MDKIQYLNYIKDKYKIQPMVRNIFIIGTPSMVILAIMQFGMQPGNFCEKCMQQLILSIF